VIQKDGTILLNGKKAAKDRLAQLLSETKAASRDVPVLVSADENVSIETITLVMDACRKAGFNKFSLQTR
jgi:biopolymer transport protein ExbD